MNTAAPILRCERCHAGTDVLTAQVRCAACGGLLTVEHATPMLTGAALRAYFDNAHGARRPFAASGVWRFAPLVLPDALDRIVSYPEGNTPLLHRERIDRWCGMAHLRLKHEGLNPTGSFKDRGMTVGVTHAKRIGARAVACASTGNTSASLAAYAAQAGLPALALVPEGQIALGKLGQTLAYGAKTLLVHGDFDACLALIDRASTELGIYLINSINPFRLEGQKTIAWELLQQLDWDAPDWIVLPGGNLGNTAAFGKALNEALAWGLIDRLPRLAVIQAGGAAPFARAFDTGFGALVPVAAQTVATAIKIGAPASYTRAVHAVTSTNGVVIAVSDAEILAAKREVDAAGVGCEPASAASVAGVRALRARDVMRAGDRVVAVLTGHVLKDPGMLQAMHGPTGEGNAPISIAPTLDALRRVVDEDLGLS